MIIDYAKSLVRSEEEIVKWDLRYDRINNKLCDKYYEQRSNYYLLVGSIGRETAIKKTSDNDIIFILPQSVYAKFNAYESNGQSQLLQEVKAVIIELYPKTKIKGDGQVVSIQFTDGVIELVPAFKQDDCSFKYPDSNDGGSWKVTKPLAEIEKSKNISEESSRYFNYLCYLMRQWKNNIGFSFKGLLIDSLVFNFLQQENIEDKENFEIIENCYKFLTVQRKDQSYWYALGSNQKIYNDDNGKFIDKAKKALKLFADENEEIIMKELFGYNQAENKAVTEEFVEDKFMVDVKYNLKIDCDVFQNGFRGMKLSQYISSKFRIGRGKTLRFNVVESNIPIDKPIKYYWKVRNKGIEAIGKERGQIFQGSQSQTEHTSFNGDHYVECYAVSEGIVIARDRIKVPIDIIEGK